MSFFDALCHGLSTVSLGGFSTRSESIGFYNSHAIELVAGLFSLLSAFNFTLWYVAIVKRTFKPFRRNAELQLFLIIALVITLIATWQVWRAGMYNLTDSLVHAFFWQAQCSQTTACRRRITPSGLHILSSCFSSPVSSGVYRFDLRGIKALRFLIMFKQCRQELHQLAHPRALLNIKVGNSVVNERVIRSVWSFFFLYALFTSFSSGRLI